MSLLDQFGFPWQQARLSGSGFAPGVDRYEVEMSGFPVNRVIAPSDQTGFPTSPHYLTAVPARLPSLNPFVAYLGNGVLVSYPSLAGTAGFRSTDYGQTWRPLTMSNLEKTNWVSDGAGFGIISCGVNFASAVALVTRDYGQTWQQVTVPSLLHYARAVQGGFGVTFGFNSNTCGITRDYGQTWQTVVHGGSLAFNSAAIRQDGLVLACARNTTQGLVSTHYGFSWSFTGLPATTASNSSSTLTAINDLIFFSAGDVGADRRPWVGFDTPLRWGRVTLEGGGTISNSVSIWFHRGRYWMLDGVALRAWSSTDGFLWARAPLAGAPLPGGTGLYSSTTAGPILGNGANTNVFTLA